VERFHTFGRVAEREYGEEGTSLTGWIPEREIARFEPFIRRVANADVEDDGTVENDQAATSAA
jgi:hypothetical protein